MHRARPLLALVSVLATASCGGAQRPTAPLADRCEATHRLRGDDEIDARIDRLTDGWLVSFSMRVRLGAGTAPIRIRGLGRVVRAGDELRCQIVEAEGEPGAPRFDEAVCLDELETLADLIDDAERAARPGETVVQEVQLRARRRRAARSSVRVAVPSFRERAEVTRDTSGRVVRVVRSTEGGGREEVAVSYPVGVRGRCLPAD
jgi:hypothetical protein